MLLSLPQLFSAGVECGSAEARTELKRQVAAIDAALTALPAAAATPDRRWRRACSARCAEQANAAPARARRRDAARRARARSRNWKPAPCGAPPRRCAAAASTVKIAWAQARGRNGRRCASRRSYVGVAASILRNEGAGALATPYRAAPFACRTATGSAARALCSRRKPRSLRSLSQSSDQPRVSIVVPMYGKPLLTYTCLKSVHANTPAGTYEVIVVDDASPETGGADVLAAVTGVRFERNGGNLGFLASCNRAAGARAWRNPRPAQQRHDRHARLAGCAAGGVRSAPGRRPGRREARLSGWPPAGSGRHRVARRLGMESTVATTTRTGPSTTICARSTIARGPASRCRASLFARARRLRRALRAGLLRGHRSRVRGARRGSQGLLPARGDDRPFRGRDVGHRRVRRRQAAPGDQSRRVSPSNGRTRWPRHGANGVAPGAANATAGRAGARW